jgi:hypothetical protein
LEEQRRRREDEERFSDSTGNLLNWGSDPDPLDVENQSEVSSDGCFLLSDFWK